MLRKRFLKPDTIGLIPTGGYGGKINYSRKALIWLVYREMKDGGRKILHTLNGREYRLPELPYFSVEGFCPETMTVYEILECYYPCYICQPYRDACRMRGETLAEKYERTMVLIEQIARAGYHVEIQWECEFDEEILTRRPELKTHPVGEHFHRNTRDALYGGRTEAMRLHYCVRGGEKILLYMEVMSLYPMCVNISNLQWRNP